MTNRSERGARPICLDLAGFNGTCGGYLFLGMIVMVLVLAIGCSTTKAQPKPVAWNIKIEKTVPASIEVHLIPVNRFNRAEWENYDITEYWKPNNRRRADQRRTMWSKDLRENQPEEIAKTDPEWERWLKEDKATELLLIANLPGRDFPTGPADPRRKFLPLDKSYWAAEKGTLEIEVRTTEVLIRTAPRR